MEINSILGNYEPIDENWFGLVEGDDKTAVKLRSANKWAEEYLKVINKYDNKGTVEQKIKTVSGGNRMIRKKVQTEETKMTPEQETAFNKDIRDFMIDNVIADWRGIEENGVELPYNKENALKVFDLDNKGTIVLILNIMQSALKPENFTKASEYTLEDEETVKK